MRNLSARLRTPNRQVSLHWGLLTGWMLIVRVTQSGRGRKDGESVADAGEEAASEAGLRYVTDQSPGIRRIRAGRSFRYKDATNRAVNSAAVLARIKSLVIPPAWTDVWICPSPNGHIQATGRDKKGRKQYRYHDRWREVRDANKYERLLEFAGCLPSIRRRVTRDLRRAGLPREKVLATLVRLLDTTYIRVGNEEYARDNESFGLTTMRNRHVHVSKSQIKFEFRGKSGKMHSVEVNDLRLARVVKQCQELPGYELFQYVDENDERHQIESQDVNDYIQSIIHKDFTAKDFRTWGGTVLAAWALEELGEYSTALEAKNQVVRAIDSVAKELGNTRSVCRQSYVHPEVLAAHMDGTLLKNLERRAEEKLSKVSELSSEEAAIVALLRRRLADVSKASKRSA